METFILIIGFIPTKVWVFLGTLLCAWFTYRGFHHFAAKRAADDRFAKASRELIAAFVPELAALNSPVPDRDFDTRALLMGSFKKHRVAAVKFQNALSRACSKRFAKDWKNYHHSKHNFGDEWQEPEVMNFFGDYLAINQDEESSAKELAIRNIEKLLSYTKGK